MTCKNKQHRAMHNQHFSNQRSQQQWYFPITHKQNFIFSRRADLPPQCYHNTKHTRTQSPVINHDKDAATITQPSPGQYKKQRITIWHGKATTMTKPPLWQNHYQWQRHQHKAMTEPTWWQKMKTSSDIFKMVQLCILLSIAVKCQPPSHTK